MRAFPSLLLELHPARYTTFRLERPSHKETACAESAILPQNSHDQVTSRKQSIAWDGAISGIPYKTETERLCQRRKVYVTDG